MSGPLSLWERVRVRGRSAAKRLRSTNAPSPRPSPIGRGRNAMTATSHSSSAALDYTSVAPAPPRAVPADREAVRVWAIPVAVILAMYLLLVNPYWVPGGDSELYLAAGRSLALGEGYRFNGQRVNISPPGWPLVLAGAMRIHPTFLFIKLITLVCMA